MPQALPFSRRRFLQSAGASTALLWKAGPAALAAVVQAACTARDEGAPLRVLGEEEAADFAAIAARIIPTTATPGATEAGVVHFFDQAFAGELADLLPYLRQELSSLNAATGGRFAAEDTASQDFLLQSIEAGSFFRLMRMYTLFGFFAMSRHGGNRNHIGWDLVGFDGHHGAWQYPFGYYDAEWHGATDNDD